MSTDIQLTANARTVLEKRYLRKDELGNPIETPKAMFYRIANHIAAVEAQHAGDVEATTRIFYNLMASMRFLPNSPTFTGAGTPLGQLAACFVLPVADDLGKAEDSIFSTLHVAALIQQTGGGNGFDFSKLRMKGDFVRSSAGRATGPVGFMHVYDRAFAEISQGGTRRGANMAVLRVDHPDIEQFIACKTEEGTLSNFNISVAITDAFMKAVVKDDDHELRNPRDGEVVKTVSARRLFDKIIAQAHHNGEPGALFIDAANRANPLPDVYDLDATNPCGEQWLGPYENCCLGSINLARHVYNGAVDWERLKRTVRVATLFLDNTITANAYLPTVPEIEEAALLARRIGLGIMGLADMMYHLGIRYGSEEGQEFAAQVMEFVRFHCIQKSVELACERGPFAGFARSIYDDRIEGGQQLWAWSIPTPIASYKRNWGRPNLDLSWGVLENDIRKHGIRNAAQTTIAPTGTIATVAGCEGYGCEPVFALGYTRHFQDGDEDVELPYVSPLFTRALQYQNIYPARYDAILAEVTRTGTCQHIKELPKRMRDVFVVAADITAEEHVRMQASLQAFVDNSISKTCNFSSGATEADVAQAYMQAWELGCKGLTVYVNGSREKAVLETGASCVDCADIWGREA